jgi:3-hydroxyisobutyrate dehydrogenase-like beta-hydroxyacid dehydrogenase
MNIGFIGLGFMGEGMAANILKKGHSLTILGHKNRAPIERLIAQGAVEAKTPQEVAQASDIVFLCVTGSPEVEANVRGTQGLKAGAKKGLIIVDCSTANPVSTQSLYDELLPLGITFVDAPLGGTPAQAQEGTLSAMVGCDEATFKILEPVILSWANKAVHLPRVGMGHQMKLLNNFFSMGYAALYAEGLAIAAKSGISAQMIDNVIRGGRMDCGFYQTFFKYVLEGDENAHLFTLKNAHKDVSYLAAMADAAGVANPLGAAVKNYFTSAVVQGKGAQFVPMLSDHVKSLNGV